MMAEVIAYTMVSPDGVIGLNGRWHLLDDEGELLKFDTVQDAKDFIEEAGEDPDDEYIGYAEVGEDGKEYDIDHSSKERGR